MPTSGRRVPDGRDIAMTGVLDVLDFEGVVRMEPEMLAQRFGPAICVPGPIVLAVDGPRICPGSAIVDDSEVIAVG